MCPTSLERHLSAACTNFVQFLVHWSKHLQSAYTVRISHYVFDVLVIYNLLAKSPVYAPFHSVIWLRPHPASIVVFVTDVHLPIWFQHWSDANPLLVWLPFSTVINFVANSYRRYCHTNIRFHSAALSPLTLCIHSVMFVRRRFAPDITVCQVSLTAVWLCTHSVN